MNEPHILLPEDDDPAQPAAGPPPAAMVPKRYPNPDTVNRALAAVTDLVVETLQGPSISRFAEAERLARIGHELTRTQAQGVHDFAQLQEEEPRFGDYGRLRMGGPIVRPIGPIGDAGDVIRSTIEMQSKVLDQQGAEHAAKEPLRDAQEMNELVELLEGAPDDYKRTIQARLDRLVQRMEARNAQPVPVVSSELSRRHPAHAEGPGDDRAPGVRADAEREGGAPRVAFACGLDDVGPA